MAGLDVPPQLKSLKRFLREAKTTEKVKPVLSYYCRLYALQEAMKLPDSKKDASLKAWMGSQMGILEGLGVTASRDEAKKEIQVMADNVFSHADKIDRAGDADKKTAKMFNSAFVFYECLKQFGDREEGIAERAKYCMFKTTDILKAIREGRKPDPGPPGGDDNELENELNALGDGGDGDVMMGGAGGGGGGSMEDPSPSSYQSPQQPAHPSPSGPHGGYSGGGAPSSSGNPYYQPPPSSSASSSFQPRPPQASFKPPPASSSMNDMQFRKFEDKVSACVHAEKMMKQGLSAMKFNDINTAILKCREVIATLEPHRE